MKRFKMILLAALAALPLIITAIFVFFIMPDTVAAHFGVDGAVDRWGSKYEAFIFPGVILLCYALCMLGFFITKRTSTEDNSRVERNLDVGLTVVISIFVMLDAVCVMLLFAMNEPGLMRDTESVIFPIISTTIGIVFIVLGNVLPKTKKNSMVGMRLNFTMDTDAHWRLANRAGGIALVFSGFVTVIAGLITRSGTYIIYMIIALILSLTVAIIYSYVKIKGESKAR